VYGGAPFAAFLLNTKRESMMRVLKIGGLGLGGLVAAFVVVGLFLPRH